MREKGILLKFKKHAKDDKNHYNTKICTPKSYVISRIKLSFMKDKFVYERPNVQTTDNNSFEFIFSSIVIEIKCSSRML